MQANQRQAARVVAAVLEGRNLDRELAAIQQQQPEAARRAAVQDLSFGTLRHLGILRAALKSLLDKPLSDPLLSALLLVALHQLRQGRSAPHAVVDQAVRAAEAEGLGRAKGLVNAVLRNALRQEASLWTRAQAAGPEAHWNHPAWWVKKLRAQQPDGWERALTQGNGHPPMTLRVNRRQGGVDAYLADLEAAGMAARPLENEALLLARPCPVDALPGFRSGRVSVQDAGAQRAARYLDARAGQRVLDACAAPGGKTAHLLEQGDPDLIALDVDAARLEKVRENLARLGLSATCTIGDAADPAGWWDGGPFERILADVPCSGSGVVRRHPDIKWLRRESDLAGFAAQQGRILDALWRCLARGGKLLYATCSVFEEENGHVVDGFLARHPDAEPAPLPGTGSAREQLLPDESHDGFFYALLHKR